LLRGLCTAIAAACLLTGAPASAATRFEVVRELSSTPAGQFENPFAVAVGQMFGETYVLDRGRKVVDRFDASGLFVSELTGTPAGAPVSGPFGEPEGVAVDASGDVFVIDAENRVVDEFDAAGAFVRQISEVPPGAPTSGPFGGLNGSVAVSQASGAVYVGDSENKVVDEFSSSGAFIGQLTGTPGGSFGSVRGLAVDGGGNVYVADNEAKVVDELTSSGAFVRQLSGTPAGAPAPGGFANPRALAVDQTSSSVFTADNGLTPPVVDQFDASGAFQTQLALAGSNPVGLAVDGQGDLYVADNETRTVKVLAPKVIPDVSTGPASNVAEASATLGGSVNPDGLQTSSCAFEYGTSSAYGSTAPCSQSAAEIGTGTNPVPVSAVLAGLAPRTTYHFRLVAANANGANQGEDRAFTIVTAPVVEGESAVAVSSSGATLQARVNPGGAETSYHFEYGTTAAYGTSLPVPAADVGSGLGAAAVAVRLQELRPGTPYHYRLAADNALGSVAGADHVLVTARPAGPFALPDGRAWEMVSPAVKHGGVIEPLGTFSSGAGGVLEASTEGSGLTYLSDQSLVGEPEGESNLSQVLSTRTPGGWSSQDIATPHQAPSDAVVGGGSEYRLFSPDLSLAIVAPFEHPPGTPLSADASERTPYLRESAGGRFRALLTAANVPPGTRFGGAAEHLESGVRAVDASPDLAHVILHSQESGLALTPAPVEGDGLYEWSAGHVQLVSVLPDGSAAASARLGYEDQDVRNAISRDGSRVFWESIPAAGPHHLYVRDARSGETLQLDTVQPGGSGAGSVSPRFQAASADGSRVFFTDHQGLSEGAGSGAESEDLYACDLTQAGGKLTCRLSDLTVEHNAGESAEVQGSVLGSSEDGSRVYFLAKGALSGAQNQFGEAAAAGHENLYVERFDGGQWEAPRFIASLSPEDRPDWETLLSKLTARVSPNGRYLAFMSDRSLTGYDNTDATSGQRDEEVYLYDASTARLVCASCDPTGARPNGMFRSPPLQYLIDAQQTWEGRWLAASVPEWQSNGAGQEAEATHQPRYLLDSGRLFFNSSDQLVPQAVNASMDVYEYEPSGIGGCREAAETFSRSAEGCVSLLSSGTASQESAFLDSSEAGGDAFFLTTAALTPMDVDRQRDVYDAHECTAASPCVAQAAAGPAPPCESGETCRPASPFSASGVETPPTSSFAGELAQAASGPAPPHSSRPIATSRARRLAIALRACRSRHRRAPSRRAACERRAHRQLGHGR
jgi:hypothetical protein